MARRKWLVILAPAPWITRPLWKEQLPAFIFAATGAISAHRGYISKMLSMFFPIATFSKLVILWDPGRKYRQPFSRVASSRATQIESAFRSEKDQKGVSRCQAVGLAHGRLNKAWSCHILIPSEPDNFAAISPIR